MFKICDGRTQFYQWDVNRKIIVMDDTITEVHFCNKTDDCSLVTEVYEEGGKRVANVPNILLQENRDITVYGYCDNCYTMVTARFKVIGRTKPADYVYTETEVKRWETIEKRCQEALELAETLSKGANSGQSFIDYATLINELNTADKDKYFYPQHFLIKTLGVPDVWVYDIKEESVPYEYIDDETFASAVVNETVQVGYYVLSALETQKVVLDDYVKVIKSTRNPNFPHLYAQSERGTHLVEVDTSNSVNTIVKRTPNATVRTGVPVSGSDATQKDYVDNLPDNLELTDEQKTKWLEWLGALKTAGASAEGPRVYMVDHNGNQKTKRMASGENTFTRGGIPISAAHGAIYQNGVMSETQWDYLNYTVNRRYVDSKIKKYRHTLTVQDGDENYFSGLFELVCDRAEPFDLNSAEELIQAIQKMPYLIKLADAYLKQTHIMNGIAWYENTTTRIYGTNGYGYGNDADITGYASSFTLITDAVEEI